MDSYHFVEGKMWRGRACLHGDRMGGGRGVLGHFTFIVAMLQLL